MENTVISARLKELRRLKGVSQAEIAKYLEVDRTTYTAYESGKSRPVRYMDKLAAYFGVSSDYLMGMTDSQQPKEILFHNLTEHEMVLLLNYRSLNENGKKQIADYVSFIMGKEEYQKEKPISA